jgi:ABC-2 type transport system ATP-binding protein
MKRMIMASMRSTGDVTVKGRRYHDLPWPLHEVGALLEAKAIHPVEAPARPGTS